MEHQQAHGVLVEVLGLGVLILGPSGVGKSECGLELVGRGHRLVADDVVRLVASPDGTLVGSAPEVVRHYMEIRGLGLLYVPDLFGPGSVRDDCSVDLVCRLERWRDDREYERVGLDRPTERWLGVALPCVVLPVRPAGNMATLVEVAVRDTRLRRTRSSAAHRLDARLRRLGEAEHGEGRS